LVRQGGGQGGPFGFGVFIGFTLGGGLSGCLRRLDLHPTGGGRLPVRLKRLIGQRGARGRLRGIVIRAGGSTNGADGERTKEGRQLRNCHSTFLRQIGAGSNSF
jgi:hypothetical protein